MKAAVLHAPGPPEALQYAEIPDPVCGPDDLLMQVHVVSIEGGDTLHRTRPLPRPAPHVIGYHAAGVVAAVGAGVSGFSVGDRVTAFGFDGSHAELRVVQPRYTFHVPAGMNLVDAAVVPISFGTAHVALFDAARLKLGETVLIPAAASGLGVAAIQIAQRAGARVLVAASSAAKLERLRDLKPDVLIDSITQPLPAAVREATGGRGVDVIMDGVGGSMLQHSIASLAYGGRVAMVGAAGREAMLVDVSSMQRGAQTLTGVFLGAELGTPRIRDLIDGYLRSVAGGEYRTVIDRRFHLAEAAQAHAWIESRKVVGRVVMTTDACSD